MACAIARLSTADATRRPSAPETIASNIADGMPGPGLFPRPCLVRRIATCGLRFCPHAPSPRARPRAGWAGSPSDSGSHREISGTLNRREVGRGWDTSEADTRPGPPGVVRTPPAAAVRPLPGVRRPGPGPGSAPEGRRRARLGRVSAMSTIGREPARCRPGPPPMSRGLSSCEGRIPNIINQQIQK